MAAPRSATPPPPAHSLSRLSPQSRGGPLKFELTSWLQIEGAEPDDSGTYRCIARNNLGSVSASAVLGILGAGEPSRCFPPGSQPSTLY